MVANSDGNDQGHQADVEPLPAETGFFDIDSLPGFSPIQGVQMNVMAGARAMCNWVRIDPGATVPLHDHPHEQLGLVLEGSLEMTIGDETRVIEPGVSYIVPGGVPHAATAGAGGCLVLDIFSPPREDYRSAAQG